MEKKCLQHAIFRIRRGGNMTTYAYLVISVQRSIGIREKNESGDYGEEKQKQGENETPQCQHNHLDFRTI